MTSLMFLAIARRLTVDTPAGEQLVLLTGYNPVAVGDTVSLTVERERVHLLARETEILGASLVVMGAHRVLGTINRWTNFAPPFGGHQQPHATDRCHRRLRAVHAEPRLRR